MYTDVSTITITDVHMIIMRMTARAVTYNCRVLECFLHSLQHPDPSLGVVASIDDQTFGKVTFTYPTIVQLKTIKLLSNIVFTQNDYQVTLTA